MGLNVMQDVIQARGMLQERAGIAEVRVMLQLRRECNDGVA